MTRTTEEFAYLRPHLTPEDEGYLECHRRRFRFTLELVQRFLAGHPELRKEGERFRIMDIGPHFLTMILREETDAIVNQLGFADSYLPCRPRKGEQHFAFDLNDTVEKEKWPAIPAHHLIVAGEVVEHLHTSPNHWLAFLRTCLVPGGGLIITTPNGVALKRRLLMLSGRHPYELIRDNPRVPGHFREYTRGEMEEYGKRQGFQLIEFHCRNHLDYPSSFGRVYNRLQSLLPASFRDTMYLVFQR